VLEQQVREALERARIRPSRARGQHFLISDSVLASVIAAARLDGTEIVVEIGPGLGTLTQSLAARAHRVHAFELDERVCAYLRRHVLPAAPNVALEDVAFNKYVLEPVIAAAKAEGRPLKIVTNLPYQISSAFLHTVVDYRADIALTVVMLQREVAARLVAPPGGEGYGSFSLYMQAALDIAWVCDAPRECFHPPPKVDSAVVALTPRLVAKGRADAASVDPARFEKLVQAIFRRRRKQMLNALRGAQPHLTPEAALEALSRAGIDPHSRPEDQSREDFARLAAALWPEAR
jgi:16S rRNA (adenine1518-N6/adenine1519-N6)-dimethyltransferase